MSKNPRRVEGTVSWSGMDKVGGKGNEKTTSAGQRVCERVRVFWSPHRPPLLSSPPREGEGLPRGCLALSLDLRVGTAPGFKGGSKGGRPLLPLPHIPHHTPKPPLPRRWDPSPSRAPGPVARPLPWHPHPRPQPRLQMAAPSARLAAPRRRPAAAAGRSLPPSCCGDHDCSARRAGSCAGSAWGRSRAAEGRSRAVPAGKEPTRPQVRSARGRAREGREPARRPGTLTPPPSRDFPTPHHLQVPGAAGRAGAGPQHPRDRRGERRAAARRGRPAPRTPCPRAGSARTSRPGPVEGCPGPRGAPFCQRAVMPTNCDHPLPHFSPVFSLASFCLSFFPFSLARFPSFSPPAHPGPFLSFPGPFTRAVRVCPPPGKMGTGGVFSA